MGGLNVHSLEQKILSLVLSEFQIVGLCSVQNYNFLREYWHQLWELLVFGTFVRITQFLCFISLFASYP